MPSERIQRQIDRLLDEAERAIGNGDWETGRALALRVLTLIPESQDATDLLAAADRGLGNAAHTVELDTSAPIIHLAERRHLTVLFCDLIGSTALSQQLDPEDLREVLHVYQAACSRVVADQDGYIAQYLGDGVLVYFGYPAAHEDDAHRAVHAGLSIISAVEELNNRLWSQYHASLSVRIGVHTGLVVVGEVGDGKRREQLAIGETPNISARVQGLADPNSILISESTFRLVQGFFELQEIGPQVLRGIAEPMRLYRVLKSARIQTRYEQAVAAGLTPFVGRQGEIEQLLVHFDRAQYDGGQAIWVVGEAGIGKSRLLASFNERLLDREHRLLTCQCSAYYRNTLLHPMIGLIEGLADINEEDSPVERLKKLENLLRGLGLPLPAMTQLLTPLLSIESPDVQPPALPPEQLRRATLHAIISVLEAGATRAPTVLVIEDLHWADASTLDLIDLLLAERPHLRLLMVLTSRPEFHPSWDGPLAPVQINLGALDAGQVALMARQLAGGKRLPDAVLDGVVEKTEGVPLFVEEFVKAIRDSGVLVEGEDHFSLKTPLEYAIIPTTLRGLLMGQLDQLGTAKDVAGLGAILGRQFSFELLEAVSPLDRAVLKTEIERLMQHQILMPAPATERESYIFRHALIQDTAYDSLLRSTRQQYHARTAATLEDLYPEEVALRPELVGYHWSRGQVHEKAVNYLAQAAGRAARAYANREAVTLYQHAIDEVREIMKVQPSPSREWLESLLHLQEGMGDVLTLNGDRDEARAVFLEALQQSLGDDRIQRALLYRKIALVDQQDKERAREALALAEAELEAEPSEPTPAWRREWVSIQLGKLRMHYWYDELEQMVGLIATVRPFIDGYVTPLQRSEFFNTVLLADLRREQYRISASTVEHAAEFVRAAEQIGDVSELAAARFHFGFTLLWHDSLDEAGEELQRALEAARKSGNKVTELRVLSYLTTLYRRQGRVAEMATTCQQAQDAAEVAGAVEYAALAKANRAWQALSEGNFDAAAELAQSALNDWKAFPMVFPFQWTAVLPLMAAVAARADLAKAAQLSSAVLDSHQHRLPEALAAAARDIGDRWDTGDSVGTAAAVQRTLSVARSLRYL